MDAQSIPPTASIPQSAPPEGTMQLPPEVAELLSKMNDIDAPSAIGWWPLAPGWWLLLIIVLLVCLFAVNTSYKWWRGKLYRRQALSLLDQINPENTTAFASEISSLLKRVALSAYPSERARIAPACGLQWVHWLNQSCSDQLFVGETEKALSEAPYRNNVAFDPQKLKNSTRIWIQKHV